MADTTTSTNMSMPVPIVGQDPGPQWATDINSCLGIIDQHDHSAGLGVQITPGGININSALTMGNNLLTNAAGIEFSAQSVTPANGTVYVNGSDLYFVDGVGNNIRFTQSGSLAGAAGTITGLPSGTASASYAAGVFVFQSATNTGADVDGRSFILRNNTASSNGLTLSPPNAMGANYTITLPALPASSKFLSLASDGTMSAVWAVDGITLEVSSNSVQAKDGGISQPKLYTRAVSTTAGAGDIAQAAASGSGGGAQSTSTTPSQIGNQSVTIVTTGRPVLIMIAGFANTPGAFNNSSTLAAPGTNGGTLYILRDGTNYITSQIAQTSVGGAAGNAQVFPLLNWVDQPPAGSHTYYAYFAINNNNVFNAFNVRLVAFEIN